MLVLSGGCNAGPVHPYDQDLAQCRRAAAAPSSLAIGGGSDAIFGESRSDVTTEELATGAGQLAFDACMRRRFAERFPGTPYPLDVQ